MLSSKQPGYMKQQTCFSPKSKEKVTSPKQMKKFESFKNNNGEMQVKELRSNDFIKQKTNISGIESEDGMSERANLFMPTKKNQT